MLTRILLQRTLVDLLVKNPTMMCNIYTMNVLSFCVGYNS